MINLLPWRERLRERRRRRFLSALAAAVVMSLLMLLLLDRQMAGSIAAHATENQRLRTEIGMLGLRGEEAERLRREQANTARHMQVLNSLQFSRPAPTGILAALATHLPEAAFYRLLKRNESDLRLEGVAKSHAAIAELMRNLTSSPWFAAAQLEDVSDDDGDSATTPGSYRFSLSLQVDSPGEEAP